MASAPSLEFAALGRVVVLLLLVAEALLLGNLYNKFKTIGNLLYS
jgi:hypothetical protein